VHVWRRSRASPGDSLSEEVQHLSVEIDSLARGLHPLASGEVLIEHCDGSYSIISSLESGPLKLQSHAVAGSRNGSRWTHHISVLDRFASATIMRSASRAAGLSVILRFTSLVAQDSPAKRTRSRKSAIDVIDEVEGLSTPATQQTIGSGEITLELFTIEEGQGEDRIKALSSLNLLKTLHLGDAKEVKDVTMYHSGRLAFLTTKGMLLTTTLKLNADSSPALGAINSIFLPLAATSGQSSVRTSSLQLITSSTALLIVGQPLSGTISALLVDLNLACVLAESSWAAKGVETVCIHRVAGSTALIIASRGSDSSKVGANLWALPYEISEEGHLRWALANSNLSKKWIGIELKKEAIDEAEMGRRQLMKELERIAVDKKDDEAGVAMDSAFDKWHKKESARLEEQWLAKAGKEAAMDEEESSDSDTGKAPKTTAIGRGDRKRKGLAGKAPLPAYPQLFVTQLLDFALPSSNASDGLVRKGYARQIIHQLLDSRVISRSTRVDLMPSLVAVNDWDAIIKAPRSVNDLPEQDIVDVLLRVIRGRHGGPLDAKKVDSFLAVFASISLNRSQLRVALKSTVEEVDDIVAIFDILCAWLDRTQDTMLQEFHLSDVNGAKKKSHNKSKLPAIDHILTLLCDMMDTYFPLFLSTSSTHEHLQRLSKQIDAHLAVYNQVLILRGPLAAFSRLEADRKKEVAAAAIKMQARDAEEKLTSLRKANKKAVQGKSNVIGEVGGGLGKGVLGEKSRRRQMYEENVAVGLYSLERLEL
jgi:hypothetical protein